MNDIFSGRAYFKHTGGRVMQSFPNKEILVYYECQIFWKQPMFRAIFLTAIFATLLPATVHAQNDLYTFNEGAIGAHNRFRAMHGAANLDYDQAMAVSAKKYAEELARTNSFQHSNYPGVGENLYSMSSSSSYSVQEVNKSGIVATERWYKEKDNYEFSRPGFAMNTGHFTQVVWKGTKKIGCGAALSQSDRKVYVVCQYSPPGNYESRFPENVLRSSDADASGKNSRSPESYGDIGERPSGLVSRGSNRETERPGGIVTIRNSAFKALNFAMRCEDPQGAWKNYEVQPDAASEIPSATCPKFIFKMATTKDDGSKNEVKYTLYANSSYRLMYDKTKDLWDLKKITSERAHENSNASEGRSRQRDNSYAGKIARVKGFVIAQRGKGKFDDIDFYRGLDSGKVAVCGMFEGASFYVLGIGFPGDDENENLVMGKTFSEYSEICGKWNKMAH